MGPPGRQMGPPGWPLRSGRPQAKQEVPPVATSGDIETCVLAGIGWVNFSIVEVADSIVGVPGVVRGFAPI
jgi:hypothetical protein